RADDLVEVLAQAVPRLGIWDHVELPRLDRALNMLGQLDRVHAVDVDAVQRGDRLLVGDIAALAEACGADARRLGDVRLYVCGAHHRDADAIFGERTVITLHQVDHRRLGRRIGRRE